MSRNQILVREPKSQWGIRGSPMMEKKSKSRLHGAQHSSEILFGIVPLPTVWGHFIFVPLLPPHTPRPSPLSQPYFSSLCQLFISLVIFMPWPCQWPPWALVKWPYNYCIYGDWEFIGHDSGPWSEKVSYHKMFSCINHVLSVALDILGVIKITKTSLCSLEVSSRQGSKNHYGTGRSIN